ncbi:MAG: hypothetical protein ACI89T_001569 [Cognaticolwellia sp.]|jgi:hypothetical protein
MLTITIDNKSAHYQGHTGKALSYVVCANNNRVVSQGNGLHLWCAKTGEQLAHYQVEEGANYYVTDDENYLIASSFEFYESFDIQKVHLFYIGSDEALSEQIEKPFIANLDKQEYQIQFLAHLPNGDELVIWHEVSDEKQFIYALGDVNCSTHGTVLQHKHQIVWRESKPQLLHCETIEVAETATTAANWHKDYVNMLPVITMNNGKNTL